MLQIRPRAVVLALAVAGSLLLTGCSASVAGQGRMAPAASAKRSPSASPSPAAVDPATIVMRTRNAMTGGSTGIAVHGTHLDHGAVVSVDIAVGWDTVNSLEVGTASIHVDGIGLAVRGVGNDTWIEAPAAYWKAAGVPDAAAGRLDGKWITAPADDASGLAGLVNSVGVTDYLLPTNDATMTLVGEDTVGGTAVDVFRSSTAGDRFFITHGDQPLLLQVVSTVGRLVVSYPATAPVVTAPDPSQILAVPGS